MHLPGGMEMVVLVALLHIVVVWRKSAKAISSKVGQGNDAPNSSPFLWL
ncbi:hypothetical protein IAD21_05336 [Abditibacteriota bacterium]|nr:hypothetical protein IAD21_05336 [Abditibacteriota bacterium]